MILGIRRALDQGEVLELEMPWWSLARRDLRRDCNATEAIDSLANSHDVNGCCVCGNQTRSHEAPACASRFILGMYSFKLRIQA